jgi:hypothetical protein
MHSFALACLVLLAACTVGSRSDEAGLASPAPILVADSGTPVGTYAEDALSLDPSFTASLGSPELEEGQAPPAIDLWLEVGGVEIAVDPASPEVQMPTPLADGAALTLRVAVDGLPSAEIPLVVGDAAPDEQYTVCYPVEWSSGTFTSSYCGFPCGPGQRRTEYWLTYWDSCGGRRDLIDSYVCGWC